MLFFVLCLDDLAFHGINICFLYTRITIHFYLTPLKAMLCFNQYYTTNLYWVAHISSQSKIHGPCAGSTSCLFFFFNKLNLNQISIRSIVIHTFVCTYCIMRKLKQPVSISHMFSNSSIHVCFGHYTHTWNCGFENLIVLIRSHKEILANVQIKNCHIYLYMVYKQFAAYYKLKLH